MILLIIVSLWYFSAVLAAGFILADTQGKFPRLAKEFYRNDLGFSWFLAITGGPIALFISPFMTGFYQHGFMNPFKLKRD